MASLRTIFRKRDREKRKRSFCSQKFTKWLNNYPSSRSFLGIVEWFSEEEHQIFSSSSKAGVRYRQ